MSIYLPFFTTPILPVKEFPERIECCVYAVHILSVIIANHLCAMTSGHPNYFIVLPVHFGVDPSIARYKAWICGLSLARIVGSNPVECIDVCLL